MPLQLARAFSTSTAIRARATSALLSLPSLVKDADHALAREWLDNLDPSDIPKDAYDVSYARSSGPGGQHVNKTNSKAVVRLDLHKAKGRWLPPFVVPELQKTPHYHAPNLIFASQASRSAPQNLSTALETLHASIHRAGKCLVRGETSAEQKERVVDLAKSEALRRRVIKEKMKSKKADRRKDW